MDALKTCKTSLARFKGKLYLALILRAFIPAVYRTVRISLLGSLPSTSAVNIASQMMWIGVLIEVIDEGLLLPLYHCYGLAMSDSEKGNADMKNRIKTGLVICTAVYAMFEGSISIAAPGLVKLMGQKTDLQEETVSYIRIELLAVCMGSLAKFASLVLILYDWNIGLYAALTIQLTVSIVMDVFLLSQLDISFKLGVMGAAWSSVAASAATLIFLLIYCWKKLGMNFRVDLCGHYDLKWIRLWTRVGFFSALDSLMRNIIYIVVILRTMNMLKEQDSYWIANGFVWDWLLLPILPLAEVLKQDVATGLAVVAPGPINHWQKISAYLVLASLILAIWAATYPAWPYFITRVLQAHNLGLVTSLLLHLVSILYENVLIVLHGLFQSKAEFILQ